MARIGKEARRCGRSGSGEAESSPVDSKSCEFVANNNIAFRG
jgi:hypothetical protein